MTIQCTLALTKIPASKSDARNTYAGNTYSFISNIPNSLIDMNSMITVITTNQSIKNNNNRFELGLYNLI